MTEIFARVRDRARDNDDGELLDPRDPWTAVAHLAQFIMERFKADEARFAALEAHGLVDASIDLNGNLIMTFANGSQRNAGRVAGRDAVPAQAPKSLEFVRDDSGRIVRAVVR